MKNRRTQSALLVVGAAAGAVAATWMGRRRLRAVPAAPPSPDLHSDLITPDRAELPLGSSADPDIESSLSQRDSGRTTGGALRGELAALAALEGRAAWEGGEEVPRSTDPSLDEVWNSMPGLVGGEQSEGYDAVEPENLGAVWLERATQTTHEERPHASDPGELPALEGLTMSEASVTSALAADDDELQSKLDELEAEAAEAEAEDDAIAEDELDPTEEPRLAPDR